MKSRTFEFDISDIITANVKSLSPLFFLHVFVNFMEKESFMVFLTIFHKLMMLRMTK